VAGFIWQRRPCRIRNSRAFLDQMPFLPRSRQTVRLQVDMSKFSTVSISTQASDIFLYMSALLFPKKVHWIEFRFVRLDRVSGETIGEDLFFLPRVEIALGNLYRIRRQLLDTITWHAVRATGTSLRLSLWPRTESLPYSSHSTHSLLTRLPPTLSLDPRFFVHNISSNYE
jgi:hypothetical protein